MSRIQYQLVRRSDRIYDVTIIHTLIAPEGATAHQYETIGRIVLCPVEDRFFVERPQWKSNGACEWQRHPKGHLVLQAAFNALVRPKAAD